MIYYLVFLLKYIDNSLQIIKKNYLVTGFVHEQKRAVK